MADFPKLALQTGDYAAEWFVGDRRIAGDVSLEPRRPAKVTLFDDVEEKDWSKGGGFPEDYDYERIVGRLRSGQDVVLTDARISIMLPHRSRGTARHAVIGLNVADVPGDAYSRIRLQITELDYLFGVAPIKSMSWPSDDVPHMSGRFSIETNPDADRRWVDEQDSLIVDCTYDIQFSPANAHRHAVRFAPVVSFASHTPLTVDEWVKRWVMPMIHLAALATRGPQRLSWLTVSNAPADATGEERVFHTTGVVFGGGIEQAPYEAEYRDEWRRSETRPLFTLASIPVPLPDLLRRWVALEADENPFIELYGQALRQTDLPPRARFLYLIQALEALHGHEHAAHDEAAQNDFAARRTEVVAVLEGVMLPDGVLSFVRKNWSKRRPDSLDRRLRDLIDVLSLRVRNILVPPAGNVITRQLIEDDETQLEGQLRRLRNDLSHGSRNYDELALRPWVEIAETLCRAQALRLLGFDDEGIERGLAPPPAPSPPTDVS